MRIFIPTPSGRSRYNVLGAIEAISNELITVCNTGYIHALSVCELLHKIRERFIDETIPISIILDNAAIDRCLNRIKNRECEEEMKSLLNLKFQLFDNVIYNRA